MDPWIVLRHLEELEGKMADLYEWFMKLFHEDREAAAFFYTMSLEEASHRDLVRYQRRLVSKNPGLFKEVDLDTLEILKTSERVERVIESSSLSLKEAVFTSMGFEKDVTENHYRSVMLKSNPEVANLLDSLCTGDRDHFSRLNDFAQSRRFLS